MSEGSVDVDLAPFLAAMVVEAGGSVSIKLSTLSELDPDRVALTINPGSDDTTLVITVVDPNDVIHD